MHDIKPYLFINYVLIFSQNSAICRSAINNGKIDKNGGEIVFKVDQKT